MGIFGSNCVFRAVHLILHCYRILEFNVDMQNLTLIYAEQENY